MSKISDAIRSSAPARALHVVKPARKPTFADLRKAVLLFRGPYASRELRHANARKWLAAMAALGDKHVYRGGVVQWGTQPKTRRTK